MTSLLQLPNDFYIQRSRGIRYQLEKNFLNKIVQHNFKQTFPALKRLIRSKEYKNNPSVFGSKLHEEKRALTNKIMESAEEHFMNILKLNLSENFQGSWFKVPQEAITPAYQSLLIQNDFKKNIETIVNNAFNNILNNFYNIGDDPLNKKAIDNIFAVMGTNIERAVTRVQRYTYTVTTRTYNLAREIQFRERDPTNQFRYVWGTVPDSRRTPQCAEIERRVKSEMNRTGEKGVTLDRLKQILNEVANLPMYVRANPNIEWTPHWNCRSGIRRIVV